MIEARRSSAKLEYLEAIKSLSMRFGMNLLPNGFVPKGIHVSIKIGDNEIFTLEPNQFLIYELEDGYAFHMQRDIEGFDMHRDCIRVEILLFSGRSVCSSYTIERRPSTSTSTSTSAGETTTH